jgi:hypothetical protein
MPLLYVDLIEGPAPAEIRTLLDAITDNNDEDWSFGHGRAQFLTGELA